MFLSLPSTGLGGGVSTHQLQQEHPVYGDLIGPKESRDIRRSKIRKHRLLLETPKAYFDWEIVCFTFHRIYFGCSQIDGDYI